jgi:bifunctional oligoribonuclease and PAP phosphatase NrnA
MKKNNKPLEILEKIKVSKNILMTLHYGPDGDSFGSCTAMKYLLEKDFQKNVKIVSYDDISEDMKGLDFSKDIEFGTDISDVDMSKFDLVIFIDCGRVGFISGKLKDNYKLENNIFSINIDHHYSNPYYADLNYVLPKKPSASSVLIELFKKWKIKFDKELSNRLLLGLSTDSGFFTYETSEDAIKDAYFLIKKGAEYNEIILKKMYYNQPMRLYKYQSLLINNLKIDEKNRFGYSIINNQELTNLGLVKSEVRLGINFLQFIKELDFVFVLIEFPDHIKGSFRSKKGVDVSRFAIELGGSGHKEAAGFFLEKMDLNDALKKVLDVVEKYKQLKTY